MNIYTIIPLFLSPFLLFTLELMAGKHYLIHFGGSSSVWVVLILFFTLSVFLGYLYSTKVSPKIHTLVLVMGVLCGLYFLLVPNNLFPFNFLITDPKLRILLSATANTGLFVLVLSSASTLIPFWSTHNNPYQYYSISNLGSLIGLLGYPLFIEPYLPFKYQQIFWLILFIANAVLIVYMTKKNKSIASTINSKLVIYFAPTIFSMLSTAYFLVTSTAISQAVGPFSLFWALPLAIYLLSFIVSFSYHKIIQFSFHFPLTLFFLVTAVAINTRLLYFGSMLQFIWLLVTQFLVNVVLHTHIYKLRPPKQQLTSYYTSIALGGVIASLLISIVAPLVFSEFHELPILVVSCVIAFIVISLQTFTRISIAIQFTLVSLFGIAGVWYAYNQPLISRPGLSSVQTKSRSFYGFLNLVEIVSNNNVVERRLFSGETIHGSQSFNNRYEHEPTMYYNRNTAMGLLFSKPVQKVGVIGLGVGTIATYCQSGSNMTFYEIDKDVIDIANQKFTYLKGCAQRGGIANIIEGDARVSLSNQQKQKYDLIVVDAFTDDAIPVHLLTKEAISLYFSHLANKGIVALHLSSKYLDLKPTAVVTATSLGLYSTSHITSEASYVLLSRSPLPFGNPESATAYPRAQFWTDDYANIFQTIKWK